MEQGTKHCNGCSRWLGLSQFHKNTNKPDGLQVRCKECKAAWAKARRLADPEKLNQQSKQWKINHPEQHKQTSLRWRQANRDKTRATKAARRARKRAAPGHITGSQFRMLFILYPACCSCGATEQLTHDHIIPLAKGGEHSIHNSQVLCLSCNSAKKHYHCTDYRYKGVESPEAYS